MCSSPCHTDLRAILVIAALVVPPCICGLSPATWTARGDVPMRPALHSLSVVDDPGDRAFVLDGERFGDRRGKVRVGGKRVRVRSWTDSRIGFSVPARVGGGALAATIVTRDGREPLRPLPLLLEGRLRPSRGVAFRIGRARARHRLGKVQPDARGAFVAAFSTTTRRVRIRTVYKKVRRCFWVVTSRSCHELPFGLGRSCTIHRSRQCRWEHIPVPTREVIRRTWTVTVRLPVDPDELGEPRLFTSDDFVSTDLHPLAYAHPGGLVFEIDPQLDSWWVVAGRDASGTTCGEFRATDPSGRTVTGRFAQLR